MMRISVVGLLSLLLSLSLSREGDAQTVPINAGKVGQQQTPAEQDCPTDTYCRYFLPLNRGNVSIKAIHNFFNSGNGTVSFLNQVQYLYGFGGGTDSLSSDVFGGSTGFGVHASVGTSVTATPSTTSGTSSNSGSSSTSSSTPVSAPTSEQATQQLESGGELYIKGLWPWLNYVHMEKTNGTSVGVFAVQGKMNFNFDGFGGQSTLTEATEYNWNISQLGSYSYPLDSDDSQVPVTFFVNGSLGYQGVQGSFARTIGLNNKLNFLLSQASVGFTFGTVAISGQRFFGPAAAYGASTINNFSKWHFVIQFSPHAAKS